VPTQTELADRALALADSAGREDLRRRLVLARSRIDDRSVRVVVVGEPKQGKSQLVNGLVGAPICPVDDDLVTAVPTHVRNGPTPRAVLVRARSMDDAAWNASEAELEREVVPVDALAERLPWATDPAGLGGLVRAEVELPRTFLAGGLELVDTPGIGGLWRRGSLVTIDLLPSADAVVLVSDASQAFTAPEMAMIRRVAGLCPNLAFVLTKIDAHPAWRQILELDRAHLAAEGIDAPVFALTANLALLGMRRGDRVLYDESGLSDLVRHLRIEVVGKAEELSQRSLRHDLVSVTEHLAVSTRAEIAVLEDPIGGEARVRDLDAARTGIEELRRRSARWQQVLADGVTDLMADIDYDLRDRSRVITREAETAIEAQDPGANWDQFSDWLDQRITQAVADSYVWAAHRSEWLADRVLEQFAADGGVAMADVFVGDAGEALGTLIDLPEIDSGYLTMRERVLIGLKGSYTGVLMTGLVTSLAGLAIINPVSLAVGAVIGTKAYRDDKAQRRVRRQNEAKTVVRRHLDEVVFQVGKQLRDRLRGVQRTLRDLISDAVDEMSRTMNDAVQAAQRSAKVATAERDARVRELRRRQVAIERLAELATAIPVTPRSRPDRTPAVPASPQTGSSARSVAAAVDLARTAVR
jgi:hypothetical protein